MTTKPSNYEQEAERLAKAIDIAEAVLVDTTDIDQMLKKRLLEFGVDLKKSILFPQPQFKKITSLKYLENDFFTFWNETNGSFIDRFWDRVFETKLGYIRKDVLRDVIKRKRIKNIYEFNHIADNIVVYEQTGRLTADQVLDLQKYLAEFEDGK